MIGSILKTLYYFSQFSYPPTFEQIYTFYPQKISRSVLQKKLDKLVEDKIVRLVQIQSETRFTLKKTQGASTYYKRHSYSLSLIRQARRYLRLLELIPLVQYVGISGSLSMLNAAKASDIDLFIITKPRTLWMARFMVLSYKKIVSAFNPSFGRKLCFNLFFTQNGLKMNKKKRTIYIGHEILQLKTIFNKAWTYENFIASNRWMSSFFPNVHINSKGSKYQNRPFGQSYLISILDDLARSIQSWWLGRKGYKYHDTKKQLWLIQRDYEENIQ